MSKTFKTTLARDAKIMEYIEKGFTYKQIAYSYKLSVDAVKQIAYRWRKDPSRHLIVPPPAPPEPIDLEQAVKRPDTLRLVKWMREHLKIRDKTAQIVFFKPNKFQKRLDALVVMCEKLKTAFEGIILKSRQLGFSTRIEGYAFAWADQVPNTECLLAANEKGNTKKVFRITRRFYHEYPGENTPKNLGAKFNREALEYPDDHGSRIDIVTAESENSGASGTTNVVHLSEFGLFTKASDFWATTYPAWPKTPGSRMFVESTGRPDAVDFKDLWDTSFKVDWSHPAKTYRYVKTCVERGIVPRLGVFECWLDDETAEIPLQADENLETDFGDVYDDKVRKLVDEFPILQENLAKLKWMLVTLRGLQKNFARFMTEFPLKPEHPFLFYGGPAYDQVVLAEMLEKAQAAQPLFRGEIEFSNTHLFGKPALKSHPYGHLLIFEHPQPDYLYALGLDCAQGTGTGDFNEIVVVRVPRPGEKRKVVAHWRTNERGVGPGLAAVNAWLLGKYYHDALVIPERQAVNVAAIEKLVEGHPLYPKMTAPYPFLYSYIQKDRETQEEREEYGFQTTLAAKEKSVDELAILITNNLYEIASEILVRQLIGFAEDPLKKGKNKWVQRYVDPETNKPQDDGESALRMANHAVNWLVENEIPSIRIVG